MIHGSGTSEQLLLELEELRRQNARLQAELIDGKRNVEALQSRDAGWQAMLSSLKGGALFLDSEARITSCNTAFLRLLDYTDQNIKDRSLSFFLNTENDFIKFKESIFPEVLQTGSWTGPYPFKNKNGDAVIFETTVGSLAQTNTDDPDFFVVIRKQIDRQ
ncbi:MAG: PAS domain-containing protein, partial [Planctomycetes bacterium]|nr:PAS domain-containing protein [Planctomycetota bacterium]